MAYGVVLASVPEDELASYLADNARALKAAKVIVLSHMNVGWYSGDFGKAVDEALDGGEILLASLRHPVRVPKVLRWRTVARLRAEIEGRWEKKEFRKTVGGRNPEIDSLINLFRQAEASGHSVITQLDLNNDPNAPNFVPGGIPPAPPGEPS